MSALPQLSAYLFDLDGTVYLGERLIPGAAEAIERLKSRGARVMYITNKPLSRPEEYAGKLQALGVPTAPEEIMTSSMVLADYMARHAPASRVLLIGEEVVRHDLRAAGMSFTEDHNQADAVVLSWDRNFCYDHLNASLQALRRGAKLYATNPDVICPLDEGAVMPDCGAIIAAVAACSGRQPDYIAGKPGPMLPLGALARLGVSPADAALVGDRQETDIACGNRAGLATIVVLTGVTTHQMALTAVGDERADYVLPSIADLH